MKNIKVTILDSHTLRLDEDGKKGDKINLRDATSVDFELILNKIKEGKDLVYEEQLNNQIKLVAEKHELVLNSLKQNFYNQIKLLEEKLLSKENEVTNKLALDHQREVNKYEERINNINNQFTIEKMTLQSELTNLTNQLNLKLVEKENEYKDIINNLKNENRDQLHALEQELENLKRERSMLNVKEIGENLERWADTTFKEGNLLQPDNIKWYKDNQVVDGTKADFIYEVYNTKEDLGNILLTSVILEMKSEDPNAKHKQNINTILKKLDSDRNKKNIEYAILVSEIDFNNNDLSIERVFEYDKMYIVRPQYFMTLLHIITAFALKYEDILLSKEKEAIKFKDIDDILLEFENFKLDIINNQVRHINTKVNEIKQYNERIMKASDDINKAIDVILTSHLETIVNKINNFNINRLTNKIEKI